MEYPQYRKYKGLEVYFYIRSEKEFEETKVIGSKYSISKVRAIQFPEQLLIQDMLNNVDERWEILSATLFDDKINAIKEGKTKI